MLKKVKKIKEKPISWYKKKADLLFSNFIRQRDGGKCITCGNIKDWKYQQAGHYITRGCLKLRYHENNVHCQCVQCNIFLKGNYPVYSIKMMEKYGDNILYEFDEIVKLSKSDVGKFGKDFYKQIISLYE